MQKYIKVFLSYLSLLLLLVSFGCALPERVNEPKTVMPTEIEEPVVFEEGKSVNITIKITEGAEMKFELYPDKAPKTVENFVKLAKEGFYDGLTFHRIVEGFMIQGGDPEGTGYGGSKETISGEFASNGFAQNDLSHVRGAISMARSMNPNSASSQFFIVHQDATFLDGEYAAFGMMTSGWEILDALASVEVQGETPVAKPVIKKIIVE